MLTSLYHMYKTNSVVFMDVDDYIFLSTGYSSILCSIFMYIKKCLSEDINLSNKYMYLDELVFKLLNILISFFYIL